MAANANQRRRNKSRFISSKLSLLAALVTLTGACASLPKPQKTVMGNAGSAEGQWRGKALVKNLTTGKSNTLDLEMIAREPDRLRIEALGPFGMHVASVAAKGDEVHIALTRDKKFLVVPADRHALSRLVPVRLAPNDLMAILFDRPLEADHSGWKCAANPAGPPVALWACQSGTATVRRQPDENGRRLFQFVTPEAQMDLVITEAQTQTPSGESAFDLQPPSDYKVERRQ